MPVKQIIKGEKQLKEKIDNKEQIGNNVQMEHDQVREPLFNIQKVGYTG